MTHEEFKDFVKSYNTIFKNQTEELLSYERCEKLLTFSFCNSYEQLLEDRLRYCRKCSEYYRAMAEKSFWFMKRLVLRRALEFEGIHYQTLGRLMQVRLYRKLRYGEIKGFTD